MNSQIIKPANEYYSFGQFLQHSKSTFSEHTCNLIDEFVLHCSVSELEQAIINMSSNLQTILADKKNGRSQRCVETPSESRQVSVHSTYNQYISDKIVQQVPPSYVPSVYAVMCGAQKYSIVIDPNEQPIYKIGGEMLTYSEVIIKFMSACGNVTDVNVPQLAPDQILAATITGVKVEQVAMSNVKLDPLMIEDAKMVFNNLTSAIINNTTNEAKRAKEVTADESATHFRVGAKTVSINMSGQINHQGLDRYSVISNGKIAKKYFATIGLDPSLTGSEAKAHWENTLINGGEYTYWNPSWFHEKMEPVLREKINFYWFVVVPGCNLIVLRKLEKKVNMWDNNKLLRPYLQAVRRIHLCISILQLARNFPITSFIDAFSKRNGIFNMRGHFIYSFKLFSIKVEIEMEVSNTEKASTKRICDLASLLIRRETFIEDDNNPQIAYNDNWDSFFGDTDLKLSVPQKIEEHSIKIEVTPVVSKPFEHISIAPKKVDESTVKPTDKVDNVYVDPKGQYMYDNPFSDPYQENRYTRNRGGDGRRRNERRESRREDDYDDYNAINQPDDEDFGLGLLDLKPFDDPNN